MGPSLHSIHVLDLGQVNVNLSTPAKCQEFWDVNLYPLKNHACVVMLGIIALWYKPAFIAMW